MALGQGTGRNALATLLSGGVATAIKLATDELLGNERMIEFIAWTMRAAEDESDWNRARPAERAVWKQRAQKAVQAIGQMISAGLTKKE